MTQTQIQNAENQLQQEAATLQALQEQYTYTLATKEESVQREIADSIINATKRVNDRKYKADYVLATATGSAIIYANKVYDITDEVIKELNDAYKKSSKNKSHENIPFFRISYYFTIVDCLQKFE